MNGAGITELNTAGKIVNTEVANNVALTKINLGHDHLSGERAATVVVSNNDKVETLDLSTVNKIKTVTVTGNGSLTTLTMAGYSPAAEPGAAINVTIGDNNLAADYDTAVAGSETTPYTDASQVIQLVFFVQLVISSPSTKIKQIDLLRYLYPLTLKMLLMMQLLL